LEETGIQLWMTNQTCITWMQFYKKVSEQQVWWPLGFRTTQQKPSNWTATSFQREVSFTAASTTSWTTQSTSKTLTALNLNASLTEKGSLSWMTEFSRLELENESVWVKRLPRKSSTSSLREWCSSFKWQRHPEKSFPPMTLIKVFLREVFAQFLLMTSSSRTDCILDFLKRGIIIVT